MARQLLFARLKKPKDGSDVVDDGKMRLFGFYQPSLEAGSYTVFASQTINAYKYDSLETVADPIENRKYIESEKKYIQIRQSFNVVAPQFSIDASLINSFYPPSGHQDEGRILPHIVFNDPHVPWLRDAGSTAWAKGDDRTRVPWMALVVLEPNDLVVDATAASKLHLDTLDAWKNASTKPPNNGSYDISVAEYFTLTSRVKVEEGSSSDAIQTLKKSPDRTKVIFPTKQKIADIFTRNSTSLAPFNAQKLLAHVRHVNNRGMPDRDPNDSTYFSVLISSVTGNVSTTQLATQVVHLISIEHLDTTIDASFKGSNDRIAVISLFSWVYGCIPESADFSTTMNALVQTQQPLRPPDSILAKMKAEWQSSAEPLWVKREAKKALYNRLKAGYSTSRWRTPTGEETIAFIRGPLVPGTPVSRHETNPPTPPPVHRPSEHWPVSSMTGKDYWILDRKTGMMDATYVSAWSLGKLMAISDSTFTGALMRLRSRVQKTATSRTLLMANNISGSSAILSGARGTIDEVSNIINGFEGTPSRLNPPGPEPVRPVTLAHKSAREVLPLQVHAAAVERTRSHAGSVFTGLDGEKPVDSDWEIVSNWIHDTLYLANSPGHYLFTDPSHLHDYLDPTHLPKDVSKFHPEALRFFAIDDTWIDCFIDGGLSCANHTDPAHDTVRLSLKTVINESLSKNIPVPRSGFIIRSSVVKSAPDLQVSITKFMLKDGEWLEDPKSDPLLRHTRLDDFSILCLLECGLDEIYKITFAQPPHQQRFAFSVKVDIDLDTGIPKTIEPKLHVRTVYTNDKAPGTQGIWPDLDKDYQFSQSDQNGFYDAGKRVIAPDVIGAKLVDKLQVWNNANGASIGPYTDKVVDSCLLGFELNDPAYRFEIRGSTPSVKEPFVSENRQLWTGKTQAVVVNTSITTPLMASLAVTETKPAILLRLPTKSPLSSGNTAETTSSAPPQAYLHRTPLLRAALPAGDPSTSRRPGHPPPPNSPDSQFELQLHPDYRQPPPRRNTSAPGAPALYSPQSQLPVSPVYLYDLVFAIRRRITVPSGWLLTKITIEVPVADLNDGTPADPGDLPREPLLVSESYAGRGLQILSDPRFVAMLESGVSSDDGKACLRIALVPRSGDVGGTMKLGDVSDPVAAAISVRLAEVRLAAIVDVQDTLLATGDVTPGHLYETVQDGIVFVKMTETYDGEEEQYSWAVALKTNTRDKDAAGHDR